MSLIGMSVATAALLVTGCGSSSSGDTIDGTSGGTSGDAAINSVKQPTEMTDQNVTNVLNFLRDQFRQFGGGELTKVAALKAKIQEVQDANYAVAAGEPIPCEISGTETYTETQIDGGWKDEWVWDNCVETVSFPPSIDGIELNIMTSNGSRSFMYSYSDDGNRSIDTYSGADNYTQVYENNETETVSRTYTRQMSGEGTYEWNDTYYSSTMRQDGMEMQVDVNSTGDTIPVSKNVAENFITENYERADGSEGFMSADGGMSYYWQGTAEDAIYFNNFKYEWSRVNQEKTVLINGTAGSLCLGGSVSATTTTAMKENQVDYSSSTSDLESDVLPYAGGLSLSGADSVTATVGFDTNDTNHTSATVTIGDGEPNTYTSWSEMTSGWTCSIDFFMIR